MSTAGVVTAEHAPPIIDVGPLLDGARPTEIVAEVHDACVRTGFFVAVGHRRDAQLEAAFAAAHQLFELPQELKESLAMVDRRGYVPRARDRIDPTIPGATTEHYDVALDGDNPWPPIEGFADVLQAHQEGALDVAHVLLGVLAEALELDPAFFRARMRDPQCFLRLMHYQPELEPAPDGDPPVLTAPHTDYGALTLLATDGVAGLEVGHPTAGWIPVEAPPGAFVVNLGDMLARWTNLCYASTPHRVLAPVGVDRYSIPFFVNPDPGTVVEVVPTCVTAERPRRFEPVTAGEFLAQRIAEGGYMTS